jgi:hypothetical protein
VVTNGIIFSVSPILILSHVWENLLQGVTCNPFYPKDSLQYKVTTLIPKLCKKIILKNTCNDFKEKSLHTAFRNICFSREMKPRYLLRGNKMREDSSHSKHVHDGRFLFKQTDDLHKAKLLCICFNYSRNKACFCLEISNAMRLFVMEHIKKLWYRFARNVLNNWNNRLHYICKSSYPVLHAH